MELFEFLLTILLIFILLAFAAFILAKGLKVYNEHERGVRFRLGRFNKVLGPGIAFAFPLIDSTTTVDTRSRVLELKGLKALTRESATVFIDLIIRYSITAPELAATKVADTRSSLKAVAETTARRMLGELGLAEVVGKREFINAKLREAVGSQAEAWGLGIEAVEIADVTPSERTMELIKRMGEKTRKRR